MDKQILIPIGNFQLINQRKLEIFNLGNFWFDFIIMVISYFDNEQLVLEGTKCQKFICKENLVLKSESIMNLSPTFRPNRNIL